MIIGPLAAPHFPERIMNLIIDPEFESLCPDVLITACLTDNDPGARAGGMVDGRATFHMERLA
jgi:hypothetical protein